MAPPARVTKAAVATETSAFLTNVIRARDLYTKIVWHGYTGTTHVNATKLGNPDTRDVAQFIFFEIAAKFEDYAKFVFQVEVRAKLQITATRSTFVMGDLDNGLNNKLGWGSPQRLKERGYNLFGEKSFFGNLVNELGNPTYKALVSAHTVRNRIAHDGGAAQTKFVKLLEGDGIPAAQRQGMSVGRFLRDYPTAAQRGNRNFFLYLGAYEDFANKALAALP
ncbi:MULTISPECIES: hypothetical protein [Achromobacter]|uniref:hypothetical protein n=1 Tax=Achromobacter TaxID=222 RepID=UPI0009539B1F|nr:MULTISPECIES: hypothetical protein [Achromobacter]SIT04056.1 hypothetical protein SAMN05428937_0339 [Achromobacter sp. MFA1 R4]